MSDIKKREPTKHATCSSILLPCHLQYSIRTSPGGSAKMTFHWQVAGVQFRATVLIIISWPKRLNGRHRGVRATLLLHYRTHVRAELRAASINAPRRIVIKGIASCGRDTVRLKIQYFPAFALATLGSWRRVSWSLKKKKRTRYE